MAHSKHHASHEWLLERVVGLISIPLLAWLIVHLISFSRGEYTNFGAFVEVPLNAGLLITFLASFSLYTFLAMKVVYEDYISNLKARKIVIILTGFADAAAFLLGTAAIVNIFLKG